MSPWFWQFITIKSKIPFSKFVYFFLLMCYVILGLWNLIYRCLWFAQHSIMHVHMDQRLGMQLKNPKIVSDLTIESRYK